MDKEEQSVSKYKPLDYKEMFSELLQGSTLSSEQKELMEKFMEKISSASTSAQVEEALEAAKEEITSSAKELSAEEKAKMEEALQKAAETQKMFILEKESYSLRKKIETLKIELPQQAALIEKNLNKIRESKDKKALVKNASVLEELFEQKQLDTKVKPEAMLEKAETGAREESLEIYLLPDYVILPLKSTILLKSLAIYDNLIREISPELEWFSSYPSIAFINQRGLVEARAQGQAEITCRYRGTVSRKCKVTVVEEMPDKEAETIKVISEKLPNR